MENPITNSYQQDNCIEWLFEKTFSRIILDQKDIFHTPFATIKIITLSNKQAHKLISQLLRKSVDHIANYLENPFYINKFLFELTKRKLYVEIITGDISVIMDLVNQGAIIDTNCIKLAIVNNRLDVVTRLLELYKGKLDSELLTYCAEYGYLDIYFYLVDTYKIYPCIRVFYKAVVGGSIEITQHVASSVGINHKILDYAVKANHTDIISFLINEALEDKIPIDKNLISYPILNANFKLVELFHQKNIFEWTTQLCHSAILSGSIEMLKLAETHLEKLGINVHEDLLLDKSAVSKGRSTLLTNDIIYQSNGKKYFSHSMNYAIQSGSIEMMHYIKSLGYGISVSNFITALRQGTREILSELITMTTIHQLPLHIINYFSFESFVPDKISKAELLVSNGLLDLSSPKDLTIDMYKKNAVHLELIGRPINFDPENDFDTDYLMDYQLLFVSIKGFKLNRQLLIRCRLSLELNLVTNLQDIFVENHCNIDKKLIIDCLFLFGNLDQIKYYYPMLKTKLCPSSQIIMELLCQCWVPKLCYLLHNNIITKLVVQEIHPVITMLADPLLSSIHNKLSNSKPNIKYIICPKIFHSF